MLSAESAIKITCSKKYHSESILQRQEKLSNHPEVVEGKTRSGIVIFPLASGVRKKKYELNTLFKIN